MSSTNLDFVPGRGRLAGMLSENIEAFAELGEAYTVHPLMAPPSAGSPRLPLCFWRLLMDGGMGADAEFCDV